MRFNPFPLPAVDASALVFLEVIEIINRRGGNGLNIVSVGQPELSTVGPHRKLLLAIYSYFAESEREFISLRIK